VLGTGAKLLYLEGLGLVGCVGVVRESYVVVVGRGGD